MITVFTRSTGSYLLSGTLTKRPPKTCARPLGPIQAIGSKLVPCLALCSCCYFPLICSSCSRLSYIIGVCAVGRTLIALCYYRLNCHRKCIYPTREAGSCLLPLCNVIIDGDDAPSIQVEPSHPRLRFCCCCCYQVRMPTWRPIRGYCSPLFAFFCFRWL